MASLENDNAIHNFVEYEQLFKKLNITKRENALVAYKHGTPKVIPNTFLDIGIILAYPEGERYAGLESGEDWFGVDWMYVPDVGAPMPIPGKIVLEDITDWKKVVKFPNLDAIDWKKQADIDLHTDFVGWIGGKGLNPLPNGGTGLDGDKMCLVMVLNGMFERMHALMGFENALMALLEDPEASFEFLSAMADFKIEYFKKIAQYYPVDVIQSHDDYASKDRLLMSPETWRELIKPNLKRMVDTVHDLGLIYQHHSCGYIEPLLPDLVEIGVDAIDSIQGGSNKNLIELKKKYGDKITFVGGFDNQAVFDYPGATEEQIKAEFRKVVDNLAPGGSFIAFPNGSNLAALPPIFEEHFNYAADFYKRNGEVSW